ncbi:hypothetical protein GWK47_003009 [Chionoecetes opilio]|uniref:Regulatory protein zeste n=1 Tax=Chionoecetes opilio TaxID=41210 RepID=A0A8J8WMT0_CHIOP|nr:hypothetical protein GWK47_003009 [Chionoecetes opilio]
MERADRIEPISAAQSIQLLHLIKTRQDLVQDRSTGTMALLKKRKAWDEITVLFNNLYPHQIRKRTRKQLKRSFEHIKRKVKKDDGEYKRRLKAAGGGHPPKPPQHNEETALATSMMSEELAMTDKQDMIDNVYDTIKIQPCITRAPIKISLKQHYSSHPYLHYYTSKWNASFSLLLRFLFRFSFSPKSYISFTSNFTLPSTTPFLCSGNNDRTLRYKEDGHRGLYISQKKGGRAPYFEDQDDEGGA